MDELREYRKKILEEKTKLITQKFIERCENKPSYKQESVLFETDNKLGHIKGYENKFSPRYTMTKAINDILPRSEQNIKEELKIDEYKRFIIILPDEYSHKDEFLKLVQENELALKLKVFWHDPEGPYGGGLDKFSEMGDNENTDYLTAKFSKEDCERIANAIEKAKDTPTFYSLNVNGTNVILSPKKDYIFEYQQPHIVNSELIQAIKNVKDINIPEKNIQKSSDFITNVKNFVEKISTSKEEKENKENIEKILKLIESNKQILENNKKALIELGNDDAVKECEKDIKDIEKVEKWIKDGNRNFPNVVSYIKAFNNKNLEKMLVEDKFENNIEIQK